MADAKQALMRAGEHLFARQGVNGARVNELTALAGQRNQSALHYHFGSREGLLAAIVEQHVTTVDGARAVLLDDVGPEASLQQLVALFVEPLAGQLATASGRDYLRIVPQILKSDVSPPALVETMRQAEKHLDWLAEPVRAERLLSMIQAATALLAVRAVAIEDGEGPLLEEPDFVQNLIEMCTAMVLAPHGQERAGAVPPASGRPAPKTMGSGLSPTFHSTPVT